MYVHNLQICQLITNASPQWESFYAVLKEFDLPRSRFACSTRSSRNVIYPASCRSHGFVHMKSNLAGGANSYTRHPACMWPMRSNIQAASNNGLTQDIV
jgi:hypothetical protein